MLQWMGRTNSPHIWSDRDVRTYRRSAIRHYWVKKRTVAIRSYQDTVIPLQDKSQRSGRHFSALKPRYRLPDQPLAGQSPVAACKRTPSDCSAHSNPRGHQLPAPPRDETSDATTSQSVPLASHPISAWVAGLGSTATTLRLGRALESRFAASLQLTCQSVFAILVRSNGGLGRKGPTISDGEKYVLPRRTCHVIRSNAGPA